MSWTHQTQTYAFAEEHHDASEHSAEVVAHDQHQSKGLMDIDPGVSIWTLITFSLLLIILRLFAWKPIIKSLDDREKFLAAAHEDAVAARNEAKKIAEEQAKIIAEARKEAMALKEEAVTSASESAKQLEQLAIKEKNQIIESAYKEAELIKSQAITKNKETIVQLALGASRKILVDELDENKASQVVDKYIESLKA